MSEAASPNPTGARRVLAPETLLSSLAVVLLVNAVQRSVGFGRAVLFCRWLDPDELGMWEMAIGFLMLASPLAVLGVPGSFGRYLGKYRARGQLALFLRRTAVWTIGLAGSVIGLLFVFRESVASLVFGDASLVGLTTGVLACLAVVIAHHFLEAVFGGLRSFRVVSAMNFIQSMSFASIALALIVWWRPAASSVVAGYAGGCLVSILCVTVWMLTRVDQGGDTGGAVTHREFWPPLVRFAVWVWVTNLLTNVFSIVDRYMILHCGVFTPDVAMEQVGNYHTSTVVPMLLVSVANLLVGAMTPHLSHDWESGRREAVSARINLALKIATLAMVAAGVGVLLCCPTLFRMAFADKYASGLAVLPWTLAACVWFSLLLVSQTYVWCAEESRRAAMPLVIGLVVNVALNLLLMPLLGLLGAVVATAVATLAALLAQLAVNHRVGMTVDRTTLFVLFAPCLLPLGPTIAACGATVLATLAIDRGWVFSNQERTTVARAIHEKLARFACRTGARPSRGRTR